MCSALYIRTAQYMPVIHTCMYIPMYVYELYVRIIHSLCNSVCAYIRTYNLLCSDKVIGTYIPMYVEACSMYVHTVHERHSSDGDG